MLLGTRTRVDLDISSQPCLASAKLFCFLPARVLGTQQYIIQQIHSESLHKKTLCRLARLYIVEIMCKPRSKRMDGCMDASMKECMHALTYLHTCDRVMLHACTFACLARRKEDSKLCVVSMYMYECK